MVEACGDDADAREAEAQIAANFLNQEFPETQFGAPKAGYAKWASVIRVINPIKVNYLSQYSEFYQDVQNSFAMFRIYK